MVKVQNYSKMQSIVRYLFYIFVFQTPNNLSNNVMKKNKITIHDISKELKVNSSTVSRALNNSSRVSLKTRKKIQKKALELGYQRNSLASNLRTNRTYTIGVIIPRIARHFFSTIISGIEEAAYQQGYNVVICQSLESFEREKKIHFM